ncbi:hypothetical protein EES39_13935 [Streptomyces sp. ADI92-24]|nr:hypothetical protein EES39_13935 [Streptomyces sp. ADI92-24]
MHDLLHEGLRLRVAQLGLRLTLELRLTQLHRDDRRQTLADVLTRQVVVLLAQEPLLPRVPVDQPRHRRAEALLVGTALVRVDRVREGVHAVGELGVPLHRDFHRQQARGVLRLQRDDRRVDGFALAHVQVLHEVDDAALVEVLHRPRRRLGPVGVRVVGAHRGLRGFTLVGQRQGQALVEEGHLLEAARQRLEGVLGGLEDVAVGPERQRGAGLGGLLVLLERGGRHALLVLLAPAVPAVAHLRLHPCRQGVDHGHAHAVQTAGDGVAAAAELAARVQHRQYDLQGRLALGRHDVHRDATPVVDDPDPAVGQDRHVDAVRVPREGLVDRVVDDLVDQVVQTALAGRADVHTRPLADRLQTLQDLDLTAGVGRVPHVARGGHGCGGVGRKV